VSAMAIAQDLDGTVSWKEFVYILSCNIEIIRAKLQTAFPRCSICVCIWYTLTNKERDFLPRDARCVLELHLGQGQKKPILKAKFIPSDQRLAMTLLAPSRTIAMFDRESDYGILSLVDSPHV
jgi:hypothetical protein